MEIVVTAVDIVVVAVDIVVVAVESTHSIVLAAVELYYSCGKHYC